MVNVSPGIPALQIASEKIINVFAKTAIFKLMACVLSAPMENFIIKDNVLSFVEKINISMERDVNVKIIMRFMRKSAQYVQIILFR